MIFGQNKEQCPRCLGKGEVNWDDIQRLNRVNYWIPGKCAYCLGEGTVSKKMIKSVSVDAAYLVTDLDRAERKRLIAKDKGALYRASIFEEQTKSFVDQVKFLHLSANLEAEKIYEFFLISEPLDSDFRSEEGLNHINRIIDEISKNRKQ